MPCCWQLDRVLLVIAAFGVPSAHMSNVGRAWHAAVRHVVRMLGLQLGQCEFRLECFWASLRDRRLPENPLMFVSEYDIEQLVDKVLRGEGHVPPIPHIDELGRWWYKLAMCAHLTCTQASMSKTLYALLARAASYTTMHQYHPSIFRQHYADLFQELEQDDMPFNLPMQVHCVRDLGCGRLGKSIDEVMWSMALCGIWGTMQSYCPDYCGCSTDTSGGRTESSAPDSD